MDEPLILTGSLAAVQHDLAVINAIAATYWAGEGYTVGTNPDGTKYVVGKDADGNDMPGSRTNSWDVVKQAPNGDFYIWSPTSHPLFYLWRDYLPEGVTVQCAEIARPAEWDAAIEAA
ncbi:hypothetical protein [Methylobacterium sp. 1030]|uniref:hypothetical protein n=1 Tax=Methylobacterium sp. 1030 TaxID=3156404 RepID=UPI003393D680